MSRLRIIALASVVVALVATALLIPKPVTTHVAGDLTKRDITEITRNVRRLAYGPILTDFSWRSIRQVPSRWRERSRLRILSIERRTQGFVAVITSKGTRGDRAFWRVFKQGNGWRVDPATTSL